MSDTLDKINNSEQSPALSQNVDATTELDSCDDTVEPPVPEEYLSEYAFYWISSDAVLSKSYQLFGAIVWKEVICHSRLGEIHLLTAV
ncbi:hypothetical protein EGR_10411 [Echinococcus granulosus]|uniref:Uncharacterized protein n=1 Tax=Echinococcus granulosus TaxID=6210 RepID=W6U0U1_ECHGR|nr:hypothetical protein EGR_10411 [Echinococcus granulosus]EUB54730.1 hypothetical protein EGR_10411 [Echinococcus granulosus]